MPTTIANIQANPDTPEMIADLLNPHIHIPPGYEVAIYSFQLWAIKQWLIRLRIDVDYPELVTRTFRVINVELRALAYSVYTKFIHAIKTHKVAWMIQRKLYKNLIEETSQHKPTPTFATFAEMTTYVQSNYMYGATAATSQYTNDALALFSAKWLLNPVEYETYKNAYDCLYHAPWKTVFGRDVIDIHNIHDINQINAYSHYSVLHKHLITKCRAIHAGKRVRPPKNN